MIGFRLVRNIAAAAALAAALLAPSMASAHPGHAHGAGTGVSHTHHPSRTVERGSVKTIAPQELRAAQDLPDSNSNGLNCTDRGCCGNSVCHAGPSVVAPAMAIVYPSSTARLLRARDGPVLAAPAIENLKRPPKHFV